MHGFVDKLRVPVRLCVAGEAPWEGFVALFPMSEVHAGPESLLERLNAATRVLPVVRAEDGGVSLVSRAAIDWIEPGPDVAPLLVRPAAWHTTREEHVVLRLRGGEAVQGVLSMEMPQEFNRPSDFLNAPEEFFAVALRTGPRLVRKDAVLEVRIASALSHHPGRSEAA
jgi:hypothetical protein